MVVTAAILFFPLLLSVLNASSLTPETTRAFDRYTEAAEASMTRDIDAGRSLDNEGSAAEKIKLRGGEVRIDPCSPPQDIDVRGGMIQDWRGVMFIPRATIQTVKAALQDYDNYKQFYKPEVTESKQSAHHGDEYDIFLRLRKKQMWLTVVLNSEYHVRYRQPDARRMLVISRSTRIAEVHDPDRSFTQEHPVGHDSGFLWRLNSYWRFEEADGGVYAECRAISLSRDLPAGLGWMIKGVVNKFPKESMQNTLRGTKAAIESRSDLANAKR
jgi:hypothetical protein